MDITLTKAFAPRNKQKKCLTSIKFLLTKKIREIKIIRKKYRNDDAAEL